MLFLESEGEEEKLEFYCHRHQSPAPCSNELDASSGACGVGGDRGGGAGQEGVRGMTVGGAALPL